ncbi:endonuclease G, mitochondrial-like [Plodia interpunctella]|uniref:endonuclease G, mitochondrial-like n=1 Tax=Plodia interpunctella TaxID=58824 RepID=UPI002367EB8A|nr:endonuclease G, mitochondrial-like [Plodia interpunctella]
MFRKRLLYLTQLSAVGLAGYCAGQYSGKIGNDDSQAVTIDGKRVQSMPGLPIFGTVSAATPFNDMGSAKDRVSQIMKYGFPSLDNVRSYDDFVLSYDRRNRVPNWVFEHITKAHITKNDQVDRSKCDFKPDESIHPFFRSQNSDYKGSGFDRGHMAAAGNHRLAQTHVDQTFYLTNMAPQVGDGFNRHAWNRLEKHVRKLTKVYEDVYCCTGPLYLPRKESDGKSYVKYQVIGANTVAVPTHFYKLVVGRSADGALHMEAYVMPNQRIADDTPVSSFMVAPEVIERAAGLLFFDKIHRSQLSTVNGKKV